MSNAAPPGKQPGKQVLEELRHRFSPPSEAGDEPLSNAAPPGKQVREELRHELSALARRAPVTNRPSSPRSGERTRLESVRKPFECSAEFTGNGG